MTSTSQSQTFTQSIGPADTPNDSNSLSDSKKVGRILASASDLTDMSEDHLKVLAGTFDKMSDEISAKIAEKTYENLLKKRRRVSVPRLRTYKKDDNIVGKLDEKTKSQFNTTRTKAKKMNAEFDQHNGKMLDMMKSVVHLEHEYERARSMTTKWMKKRNTFRKKLATSRVDYKVLRQALKGVKKKANDEIRSYNKMRRKTIREAIVNRTKRSIQARLSRSRRLIKEAQEAERKVLNQLKQMDA
tara:strand:+ start:17226 stop:17957 length:732 start_codon:yes stop_codon:yes gene_type:complete